MDDKRIWSQSLYLFLIIFSIFLSGCKDPVNIQSKWLDKEIKIDADDTDWINYPFYYDEKTRSCIGIYNDDKNIYICFQNMDIDIQNQILRQGLYIWFNKTGGKEKELALCFPEGGGFGRPGGRDLGGPPGRSQGIPAPPAGMPSDMPGPHEGRPGDPNIPPGKPEQKGISPTARLRILTSEDDRGYDCSIERAARLGIEVKYNIYDSKRFIYELKMPLVDTDRTAFIVKASETNQIGMGFMTAKMKKRGSSGDMERSGGPGGGHGGGGPGGVMGGGMPDGGVRGGPMHGGDEGKSGSSIEIWTTVTLASKPGNFN